MNDDDSLAPEEQRMLGIHFKLNAAFRRDPSIAAMNRVYRKLRTGDAESDRAIRDHVGMLYLLDRFKPALLQTLREAGMSRKPTEMEVASS